MKRWGLPGIPLRERLLPSAATLAYHFKRSANQQKARVYEQLQVTQNSMMFNAGEAVYYTGEGRRAQAKELPLMRKASRCFRMCSERFAGRSEHDALSSGKQVHRGGNDKAKEAIDKILERNDTLTVFQVERALLVNGKRWRSLSSKPLPLLPPTPLRLELKA